MADMNALDTRVRQELSKLEQMIREVQAETIHSRLAEMQSSMGTMGDGIQRRFEALEGQVRRNNHRKCV